MIEAVERHRKRGDYLAIVTGATIYAARPLADEPRGQFLLEKLSADKKANRPLPARMPSRQQREAEGHLDPKTYYTTGPGAPVVEQVE